MQPQLAMQRVGVGAKSAVGKVQKITPEWQTEQETQ